MYKRVVFHGCLNERTGFGIHASRFTEALSKLTHVHFPYDGTVAEDGDVHVSLLDVVTAAHTTVRHPYPSILYTVWESTIYPAEFMDKIKLYDQLWVPSEWQRACSIAQGIPEEFVKVVHEGVDGEAYKPNSGVDHSLDHFTFLHVGQWQPRKSTAEICQSFLKAFPDNQGVRLYLSADTLFPSDTYSSTEERLTAYGLTDPRIIPIHYEDRDQYIRRLQSAHVFVTCARSEGWNLPLIEAMACGIPSICSDFGGSTEYSADALNVRVRELRKPHGIYGGWDVPGQWAEPDYTHLVEVMRDAYDNYTTHKAKALTTSTKIREKFSWEAAAKKAYAVLEELSNVPKQTASIIEQPDTEKTIRQFARERGYEIGTMNKRSAIFTVDCHPTSQEKMDCLVETLVQIKSLGYPILVSSHCALPAPIIEMADYYIYDKKDILSGDDKPIYWRRHPDGKEETVKSSIPCHAAAALANVRNSVDFCLGKFDWMYQLTYDTEIDIKEWLQKVLASDKPMICMRWENQEGTISGQITAAKTEIMDRIVLRINSWEEFAEIYGKDRFCSEKGYYRLIMKEVGAENIEWLSMDIGNRFNQLDKDAWGDDQFQCHFVDGPFLNIAGMSNREYQVSYGNPEDGEHYYDLIQKSGIWSRPAKKYYRKWTVTAKLDGEVKFQHVMDLKGQTVIMSFGSKALGDTLAWIPYVEEFRKKHNCTIYCSTWWNGIMDYPDIHFIKPGDCVEGVYASYEIGCFDDQLDKNVANWRLTPLQKVAADILGLEYIPLKANLKYDPYIPKGNGNPPKPYICFSEFSTMRNKFWNREGAWQKVIDYLNSLGYDCVSISNEPTQLTGVIKHCGQSIEQTITDVSGCEFYIGLNAGPTWIAYSLNKPAIMLTGVSEIWNDFPNPYRVSVDVCSPGCFNDPSLPIDRGWEWCPRKKDYACTREITETMVLSTIDKLREDIGHAVKTRKVRRSGKRKYPGNDAQRPSTEAGDRSGHV